MSETKSEVAHLLELIRLEYESGQSALKGLSQGVARHSFITARMENMGALHEKLIEIVGDQAMALIADNLEQSQTQNGSP